MRNWRAMKDEKMRKEGNSISTKEGTEPLGLTA
jgi:hypothetical protein